MSELRDYQVAAVADAVATIRWGVRRKLYTAPTGSGKSYIMKAIMDALPNAGLIAPRTEIIDGMVAKGADRRRLWTTITYRNALRDGLAPYPILLIDEAHHSPASSYTELSILSPGTQFLGFTATAFRGTPRGTLELKAQWGESHTIITVRSCVDQGFISLPRFTVQPILDDDTINVANGEFIVSSLNEAMRSRLDSLVAVIKSHTDKPTIVSVSSVEQATLLHRECMRAGLATSIITGESNTTERSRAFQQCIVENRPIIQINVVSEGVDLPLRCLIDAAPTMSPVKWLQQVGRITRPAPERPLYIGCCRNLERHGYLWQGLIPDATIREAQVVFKTPTDRAGVRAIGFESLGKFRPIPLPYANGVQGTLYVFQRVYEDARVEEYGVLLHPGIAEPMYASRIRGNEQDGWGKWQMIAKLPDFEGGIARSYPSGPCSPNQLSWWKRDAERHGLDKMIHPTQKQFVALPILAQTRQRIADNSTPVGITLQGYAKENGTYLTQPEVESYQEELKSQAVGERNGVLFFLRTTLVAYFNN